MTTTTAQLVAGGPVDGPAQFWFLLRLKTRLLRNRVSQAATESPVKVVFGAVFLGVIWVALFALFASLFNFIQDRWAFEGIIARLLIFEMLFAVLTVMLSFSSGIIVYGGLFRQREATYLMASPLAPVQIVRIKHAEALFFASWSLLVLGLPLALSFALSSAAPWYFHLLFPAYFLAFVPLPGAVGTLAASLIALWFPGRARRALLALAALVVVGMVLWTGSFWYAFQTGEGVWLKRMFAQMTMLRSALLPSTWASRGITAAAAGNLADAGFYLVVLVSNTLFATWLVVRIVARTLPTAFDRAQGVSSRSISASWSVSSVLGGCLFAYLPRTLRHLAIKDLRTFLRDAMQWSQMAILFGLLLIYVVHLPRMTEHLGASALRALVSFLNLTTVAFILATFTGRFVYPLVSLEAQQLWLVSMWPLPRRRLLVGKLLFALTITLLAATVVVLLSAYMLDLSAGWALANTVIIWAVCVGLCGLAVGLGARFPVLDQRNPARIAGGVGGTINLICSLVFVCCVLGGAAYLHFHVGRRAGMFLDLTVAVTLIAILAASIAVAAAAVRIGRQHFEALEG